MTMMTNTTGESDGIVKLGGKSHMKDARGALVPLETVKPTDKLQDEMVRKVIAFARQLSAQIARFKVHTFDDVASYTELLMQEYGASQPGGKKGNMSFTSFDGCLKIQVAVAEHIAFGPELQVAKTLIDECLTEWGATSGPELRAVINRAFQVDKEGTVNRAELFMLLRVEIEDKRWRKAMDAVRDSMRVIGSKTYIRCYDREKSDGDWRLIPIDLASAQLPSSGRGGDAA